MCFNPWLNAIIGGRGTGKSTLVDFCRRALRRDGELDGAVSGRDESLRDVFDRRMRVPASRADEGLLTENSVIEVVYRKDGERFVLSWSQDGASQSIARLSSSERIPEEGNIPETISNTNLQPKTTVCLGAGPERIAHGH